MKRPEQDVFTENTPLLIRGQFASSRASFEIVRKLYVFIEEQVFLYGDCNRRCATASKHSIIIRALTAVIFFLQTFKSRAAAGSRAAALALLEGNRSAWRG